MIAHRSGRIATLVAVLALTGCNPATTRVAAMRHVPTTMTDRTPTQRRTPGSITRT